MAVANGTNSGFVATRPTADPDGTGYGCDNVCRGTKHTSPAGSTQVTELGVYFSRVDGSSTALRGRLYTHDAANGRPNIGIGAVKTGINITAAGWHRFLSITDMNTYVSSTTHWVTVSIANHTTVISMDRTTSGQAGDGYYSGNVTLPDDWEYTLEGSDADGACAIYALYEAVSTRIPRHGFVNFANGVGVV